MKNSRTFFLFVIMALLANFAECRAADISVTNNWHFEIGQGSLQGGAGTGLPGTWQSAPNQCEISVSNTQGGAWTINIQKVDTNWNSSLALWVRRTDITSSYQRIDNISKAFFTGSGDKVIPIQFQITGVSLSISPSEYDTTIHYSVIP
jgi:hypothetical protein